VREGLSLDWSRCNRARVARDARFDGWFFTGVLTTRIYCRPTCPVKPAKSRNVVFFPTAAAAERAGFGSIRRFNAAFRAVYRRPPSALWRARRATASSRRFT